MKTEKLVEVFAEAWRQLDVDIIAPYLSDDFVYSSMWVLATLEGRDAYINYLQKKFEAIKVSGNIPLVATGYNEGGIPSVILKQGSGPPSFLIVKSRNGLITEAYMMGF